MLLTRILTAGAVLSLAFTALTVLSLVSRDQGHPPAWIYLMVLDAVVGPVGVVLGAFAVARARRLGSTALLKLSRGVVIGIGAGMVAVAVIFLIRFCC